MEHEAARGKSVLELPQTAELKRMVKLNCPPGHGPAEIPMEGEWLQLKTIEQISGLTSGCGTCAAQQGCCKLSINVKNGLIVEALVETAGCTGATHGAAIAGEHLPGKTVLEALNTHLACDAINVALREAFLNLVYGRSQTAFTEGGLPMGSTLEDLGKGLSGQHGTVFCSIATGPRYLEMTEGYIWDMALSVDKEVIGYKYVNIGQMLALLRQGVAADQALSQATATYGRYSEAQTYIDPREA